MWCLAWNPSRYSIGNMTMATIVYRDDQYDVLSVCDWGQKLSFYQLSGKQVFSTFTVTPTCMMVFSDWQGSSFRFWSMLFFLFYWRRFFLHWWLKQDYKFLFKRRRQARNIRRATELMDLVLSESSRRKRDCHHMWWWHHIVLQCQPCHCPWTL